MATINEYLQTAEKEMQKAISFLNDSLSHIRAGKANVRILDGIKVDYYGTMTALSGIASITTPDAKTIAIQPWEKSMLAPIEKAIINSEVGIMPANNGETLRLMMPPLTEERRKQLAKQAKQESEEAKVGVRSARRDTIEKLKKEKANGMSEDQIKDGEDQIQKVHDKYIKQIEELLAAKEKEIMTV